MTGGFPVFNRIKKIETKQHGSWLFASFNECSSRLGPFINLPVFKGLAVQVRMVSHTLMNHGVDICLGGFFPPNYAQCKGPCLKLYL